MAQSIWMLIGGHLATSGICIHFSSGPRSSFIFWTFSCKFSSTTGELRTRGGTWKRYCTSVRVCSSSSSHWFLGSWSLCILMMFPSRGGITSISARKHWMRSLGKMRGNLLVWIGRLRDLLLVHFLSSWTTKRNHFRSSRLKWHPKFPSIART